MEKAEQDKKSAIIRAEGEAKSAQLIGDAIQNNPSFLILRKIEARRSGPPQRQYPGDGAALGCRAPTPDWQRETVQAARDIAGTIASSSNRVMLPADSLLLNLVATRHTPA